MSRSDAGSVTRGWSRRGRFSQVAVAPELRPELARAGLILDGERKDVLPYQVFLLFKKP
ncbi:MAG: hypothetical protein JW940_07310 [Polyangiaceae bacterium]|nr:hypothetical protein [Polyangiaceae bacterium]